MFNIAIIIASIQSSSAYAMGRGAPAFWKNDPIIEICSKSGITTEEVLESAKFWNDPKIQKQFGTNNTFKGIVANVDCVNTKQKDYTIRIDMKHSDNLELENGIGQTTVFYEAVNDARTGYAISDIYESAIIYLSEASVRKNNVTLRHELGHSLGVPHHDSGLMGTYYNSYEY